MLDFWGEYLSSFPIFLYNINRPIGFMFILFYFIYLRKFIWLSNSLLLYQNHVFRALRKCVKVGTTLISAFMTFHRKYHIRWDQEHGLSSWSHQMYLLRKGTHSIPCLPALVDWVMWLGKNSPSDNLAPSRVGLWKWQKHLNWTWKPIGSQCCPRKSETCENLDLYKAMQIAALWTNWNFCILFKTAPC